MERERREREEEQRRAEEESSDDETIEEEDEWGPVPKDELELKQQRAVTAKLRAPREDDSGNDTLSESTQLDFSAPLTNIKPIDWFAGTIDVKKDMIRPYTDYNALEENLRNVRINDDVEVINSEDEESELDSASVQERSGTEGRSGAAGRKGRSKFCKSCQAPVIGRNLFLENMTKVVFG